MQLFILQFLTCEVKCEVKITFHINSHGTNELEKCKKQVVRKDIFLQVTLSLDQKWNVLISRPLYRSTERQARELGARPGNQFFSFLIFSVAQDQMLVT